MWSVMEMEEYVVEGQQVEDRAARCWRVQFEIWGKSARHIANKMYALSSELEASLSEEVREEEGWKLENVVV